jgi:hypothetical protein
MGERVAPRRRTPVAHRGSPQCLARRHSAWSGTWRRHVGARCARTSPKILRVPYRSPSPFLTDPMPPGFEMRASCQSDSAKKAARPNHGKNKSIATPSLIPSRATTRTASSTFAGSDQFYVNAIAYLSYNRVRPRTSCGNSVRDRSVVEPGYFLTDRRISGPEIQKRTYCLNDIRCGATIGSSLISAG